MGKLKIVLATLLSILVLTTNVYAERSVDDAINWAEDQIGSQNWNRLCFVFVRTAYNEGPVTGIGSAIDGWYYNGSAFGPRQTGNDIPRGALVFFDATKANDGYGHVGLYVGGGEMIHAWPTDVRKDDVGFGGDYLGWRWPDGWTDDVYEGWVSVSDGVNVSPAPVILGEDFTVSFTLKEITGAPKTFEQVAIAILRADDSLLFDLAMYDNVMIPANETWSGSATNQIWDTNPPGTYKAIIRGKMDGQWFDFDTTGDGVNPRSFTAVHQVLDGYASVSQGVTVSPLPTILGQSFTINFTLKETRGFPKTFEQVAVAILRENDSLLFDFAMYDNVTIPANGTWSVSPANVIYDTNPPGTYKAMVRGKVSGGEWFDFDVIENGVNPRSFPAILPDQDDNYEENDSLEAAFDLSNRKRTWLQDVNGLGIQADDDWYKIYVSPGYERVQIDLRFTHSEGDIDVALYDAFGNYLTSSTGMVNNEFIDFIVPEFGTHYIKIYYANAGNTYNLWWNYLLTAQQPLADIKANGLDGPVELTHGEALSITIELDPGDYPGVQADWWCVADAPFGWYYYDAGTEGWLPGFKVSYQGPLFELTPPFEVLNVSDLPVGGYTFYFGVDGNRNGNLDEPLYYDSVEVTIAP